MDRVYRTHPPFHTNTHMLLSIWGCGGDGRVLLDMDGCGGQWPRGGGDRGARTEMLGKSALWLGEKWKFCRRRIGFLII